MEEDNDVDKVDTMKQEEGGSPEKEKEADGETEKEEDEQSG